MSNLDNVLDDKVRIKQLEIETEMFRRALRFAAGYISTQEEWADKHPQEAYDWICEESCREPLNRLDS